MYRGITRYSYIHDDRIYLFHKTLVSFDSALLRFYQEAQTGVQSYSVPAEGEKLFLDILHDRVGKINFLPHPIWRNFLLYEQCSLRIHEFLENHLLCIIIDYRCEDRNKVGELRGKIGGFSLVLTPYFQKPRSPHKK
jgi:hypothetical protein